VCVLVTGRQQSHNCAVRHGTALYRFIDLSTRKVSGLDNCLQTDNKNKGKLRRWKPNILHCTTRWVYGICQEPYLVHVGIENFVVLNNVS
jgi:hypothetical protein